MKKFRMLLALLFLLGIAASANAIPIWFDADGAGGTYAPVLIDELSGEANSFYGVTQFLGADGILGNGDAFNESITLNIDKGNLLGASQVSYPTSYAVVPATNHVYAELLNLGGVITGYDDGGTPTDDTNVATSILDDTFEVNFTPGVGSIAFYYDPTPLVTPADRITLGTFAITSGGSDPFTRDNQTLTSDFGVDLAALTLAQGVWFMDNGGVIGDDLFDRPELVLLALADSSVNLQGFAGSDNGTPLDETDDFLTFVVDDNGTDVEFAVVPEPATMVLMGIGLLGIAGLSRKKFFNRS